MSKPVHIIWDNSNIFLSGRSHCDKIEYNMGPYFRIYFEHLIDLAADGRPIEQVFCVGSVPPPTDSVWGHIRKKTGKDPELYERGAASGKEQAVDQALQTRMLRLGYDYEPQSLLLLSGDGRGDEDGIGFFADSKRLHKAGWNVEILAWTDNCNKRMMQWARDNGVYVPLEDFYGQISFIEKRRQALKLDLSKRPRSQQA